MGRCAECKAELPEEVVMCPSCGAVVEERVKVEIDTVEPERVIANRYVALSLLGRGGMGAVYLARDTQLAEVVAIKVLPPEVAADERAVEWMKEEVRLARILRHDNVAAVYNFEVDHVRNLCFIVMEYIDGVDIHSLAGRKEERRFSIEEIGYILPKVASALDYAHERRVIHRDIKPKNIMLTRKGVLKVMDFGIARRLKETMSKISQTQVAGTPAYMAPEHILGEKIDRRADVYSVGASVYEMLTGRPPFHSGIIQVQVLKKQVPPVNADELGLTPETAERLTNVLRKCMAKTPDERYSTVSEFSEAFFESAGAKKTADKDRMVRLGRAVTRVIVEQRKTSEQAGTAFLSGYVPTGVSEQATQRRPGADAATVLGPGAATATDMATVRADGRPARAARRWPIFVAAAVALLAIAGLFLWRHIETQSAFKAALGEAQRAKEARDWKAALAAAENALKLQPDQAEAAALAQEARNRLQFHQLMENARGEFEKSRWQAALKILDDALALFADDAEANDLKARAGRALQKKLDRERAAALLEKATGALEEGDVTKAEEAAKEAARLDPQNEDLRGILSRIDREKRYSTAMAAAKKAVDSERLTDAVLRLREALKAFPDRTEARRLLDGLQKRLAEYDAAVKRAEALLRWRETLAEAEEAVDKAASVWAGGPEIKKLRKLLEDMRNLPGKDVVAVSPFAVEMMPADGGVVTSVVESALSKRWEVLDRKRSEAAVKKAESEGAAGTPMFRLKMREICGARFWLSKGSAAMRGDILVLDAAMTDLRSGESVRVTLHLRSETPLERAAAWLVQALAMSRSEARSLWVNALSAADTGRWSALERAWPRVAKEKGDDFTLLRLHVLKRLREDVAEALETRDWRRVRELADVEKRIGADAGAARGLAGAKDAAAARARKALSEWNPKAAESAIAELREMAPDEPEVKILASRLDFLKRQDALLKDVRRLLEAKEWAKAAARARAARAMAPGNPTAAALLEYAENPYKHLTMAASLKGHEKVVRALAWTPDGGTLLSASEDGTLRLWDVKRSKEAAVLKGHEKAIRSVAVSPDGKLALTAGADGVARIWDMRTHRTLLQYTGHDGTVWGAAWAPAGHTVATCGRDKTVHLWDARTGRIVRKMSGHGDWMPAVAFSPDGKLIASTSARRDRTVRIWSVASGRCLRVLHGHQTIVWSVAFSPDGNTLATGSGDGTVRLWDVRTGEALAVVKTTGMHIRSVAFCPLGRWLAFGCDDRTVAIWDTKERKVVATHYAHASAVWCVAWRPDGGAIASASEDCVITVWTLKEPPK